MIQNKQVSDVKNKCIVTVEHALDEVDRSAKNTDERMTHNEVFSSLRCRTNDWKN